MDIKQQQLEGNRNGEGRAFNLEGRVKIKPGVNQPNPIKLLALRREPLQPFCKVIYIIEQMKISICILRYEFRINLKQKIFYQN